MPVVCTSCQTSNPDSAEHCVNCGVPLAAGERQMPDAGSSGSSSASSRDSLADFRPGDIIAERYKIVESLGAGGMGVVYRVFDMVLNEDVALKVMATRLLQDQMAIQRFLNEARVTRQLTHKNIVRVHDIGRYKTLLYISMEFVRGKSLRAVAAERLSAGQPMSIEEVVDMLSQVCDALEYAHQFTIHRDIKPENVMVTQSGQVKLMDFGLSKLLAAPSMTATAAVMGTPMYMAPEQFRDSAHVDLRADLFSVGIMLYELLTGHVPTGMARPASQLRPEIPAAMDMIVSRCTAPDADQRYSSSSEISEALQSVLAAMYGGAPMPVPEPRKGGRKALKAIMAMALVAAVAASVGGAVVVRQRPRRQAEVALNDLNVAVQRAGKLVGIDPGQVARAARVSAQARNLMQDGQFREAEVELRRAEKLYLALQPVGHDASGQLGGGDDKRSAGFEQPLPTEPEPGDAELPVPDVGAGSMLPEYVRVAARSATEARSRANESGAATLVSELFKLAEVHWQNGNQFRDTGEFEKAQEEYLKAEGKYVLAAGEAAAAGATPEDMVYVASGLFTMGSTEGNADERPKSQVFVSGFYMDKYEVSVAKYREFLQATGRAMPFSWQTGAVGMLDPDHPAIGVTWQDAMAYAEWAGKRLPTEAEWEKAAAGTEGFVYPWGQHWEEERCNAVGLLFDQFPNIAPVTAFQRFQSPMGCYNMAGNAVEWVSSLYMPYPYKSDDGRENRATPGRRVLRGGSCGMDPPDFMLRTTIRFAADPTDTSAFPGFRCAKDVASSVSTAMDWTGGSG